MGLIAFRSVIAAGLLAAAWGCGSNTNRTLDPPEAPAARSVQQQPVRTVPPPAATVPTPATTSANLSHSLAAGTLIPVTLTYVVDSTFTRPGFVSATVTQDVMGSDGRIAIPAGSGMTLAVRLVAKKGPISQLVLGTLLL